jgi:hypothetical protein
MRPAEVLELVLDRTAYVAWLGAREGGRNHLQHIEALRELLAVSVAPDLETWLGRPAPG